MSDFESALEAAIKQLLSLYIFIKKPNDSWALDSNYKESLQNALYGKGNSDSFGHLHPNLDSKHPTDVAFLEKYASDAWEAVLHALVTTTPNPKSAVTELLYHSGLMTKGDSAGTMHITAAGFQFLLQDMSVQVWNFIEQYIEMSPMLQKRKVDVVNFLFTIGCCELGQSFAIDKLTKTQEHTIKDLKQLGIVYQRKKSTRFYPTRLATSLTHSTTATNTPGFIILETNFRLYAYTSSPLQIAVVDIFATPKARFANMTIALITRDSIRNALMKGITASQIIQYLNTHAHPKMTNLPGTVVDQIRLWETERNRLKITPAYLYKEFQKLNDFERVKQDMSKHGVLKWSSNNEKRVLIGSLDGHERVREFVRTMG